jgi:glycosyltransferase involved in cell wall biosynthesis
MKILHIITSLRLGGAEKLLSETLPLMKNTYKLNVDILIIEDDGTFLKEALIENGIKILTLKSKGKISNFFEILKHIKNYDIIHSHLFLGVYFVALSKYFIKDKILIMTEHSTHNKRRNKKYFKNIEKTIYLKYDKVISISQEVENNLKNWLNYPNMISNDKFILIENGINLKKYLLSTGYKKTVFFTADTFLLAMVGSFSNAKDQATIIKSLKYLPTNINLLLIGEGPNKKSLELLATQLLVEDRVIFTGLRNDVEKILKTIDVSIVSSNWEGFGLVAVEAMASRKPVIASNVDGLKQIVSGSGIIFEKGNDKELANKILELINDNNYYHKISEQCYLKSKHYSIDNMVESYCLIYAELNKGKK